MISGGNMIPGPGVVGGTLLYATLSANGPLSALWQILAVLALGGIVLVVVLAIIEPGPLERRRPFSREKESRQSESDGVRRTSQGQSSMPARIDGNLDRNESE